MPRLPRIKAKDFFKYLTKYDCTAKTINGSHHKIINNKNKKTSVVAIHSNEDLAVGLFEAILKQLDIDIKDFIKFINEDQK